MSMNSLQAFSTPLDIKAFREVLGGFASGVTIVTGHDGVEPVGFTCQSFFSVSLEPPLVLFSVMTTSTSYPRIRDTGKFAVNVLSSTQANVSNQFARSGTDKWQGIRWTASSNKNPLLDEALLWVDCEIYEEHLAGDHLIVVGEVKELSPVEAGATASPLVFFKGKYRELAAN